MRTYRRSGEQRVSGSAGFPVVLLTTRGAKTGRTRTAPVGGFPDGENSWLVAATLGGAARHPSWFINGRTQRDTRVAASAGEDVERPYRARRGFVRQPHAEGALLADAGHDGRAVRDSTVVHPPVRSH